jgi:hypothetical protein
MPPPASATYRRLRQYIAERMRMSHVVQPLMLMELLGRRNPTPAQDVARRILGEDVTQIDYYTERVKRMVGKVLTGNGITRYHQGAYGLVGGEEVSCLLTQKPAASGTGAATAPRSAARSKSGCSPVPRAAANAAAPAVAQQTPH